MSIEERLTPLESRLRHAEDKLEILDLLNSYGPLVDSGSAHEAAARWVQGGGYNFSGGMSGGTRLDAPVGLVAMYESESHMGLVGTGVSHFTGTPKITVEGDRARRSATRSSSSRKASVDQARTITGQSINVDAGQVMVG